MAAFVYPPSGEYARIEHWNNALEQGAVAAHSMQGDYKAYTATPFFWTRHYNKSLQYVGFASSYDTVHVEGDPLANKFLAYYIKDDKVLAVAG